MSFDDYKQMIFEKAKAAGFDNWEIYFAEGTETELSIPIGEEYCLKSGAAFRGSIGKKTGMSYTEDFSSESVSFLINSAFENAALAEDEEPVYCDGNGHYLQVNSNDQDIENIDKLKTLRELICSEIEKYGTIKKTVGTLSGISREYRVVNNCGLDAAHKSNYIFTHISVNAQRKSELKTAGVFRGGSRFSDIDPQDLIKAGYDNASNYFDPCSVKSGRYRIMFSNDMASRILQGLSIFFSAKAVVNSTTFYKDKVGCKVASGLVTVINDPFDLRGVFVCPFDSKGVPARKQILIENGILNGYLHSQKTALNFKDHQTSSEQRYDYNFPADIYPSNMYIKAGDVPFDGMLKELDDGIYITELSAYFPGHGINAVTGEYSMPASGFIVKNGKIERAADGFSIAGNLYDFLLNITGVGSDFLYGLPTCLYKGAPKWYGCYGSPSIIVNNISVAGV